MNAPHAGQILEVAETASTMDLAREFVLAGRTDLLGVRADFQTAGRGRRGAAWLAEPGEALLMTYIVPLPMALRNSIGRLSMIAGVASARAAREMTGAAVMLKWPNDLLLDGRKLGGILVEIPPAKEPTALVGVGINVNTTVFPAALSGRAASLRLHTGREWDVRHLARLIGTFLLRQVETSWEECLGAWRALDVSAGRRYAAIIEGAEEEAVTALAVEENGALRVRRASGECVAVESARGLQPGDSAA